MDNENITQTALVKAEKLIENRMNGLNKKQSRLLAGYSESTSNTNLPEKTKAYAYAIDRVLENNRYSLHKISDLIQEDIESGALESMEVGKIVDLQLKLAQIHKILTPQVTIKEEMMKDGSTKRTTWGQGSVAS